VAEPAADTAWACPPGSAPLHRVPLALAVSPGNKSPATNGHVAADGASRGAVAEHLTTQPETENGQVTGAKIHADDTAKSDDVEETLDMEGVIEFANSRGEGRDALTGAVAGELAEAGVADDVLQQMEVEGVHVTWNETLIKVLVALKSKKPRREGFTTEEVVDYTRAHWRDVCGTRAMFKGWERAGVGRYLKASTKNVRPVKGPPLTWTLMPGVLIGESSAKPTKGKQMMRKPMRLPNLDNIVHGKRRAASVDINYSGNSFKSRAVEGNCAPGSDAGSDKPAPRRTGNRRPASARASTTDEVDEDKANDTAGVGISKSGGPTVNVYSGEVHPAALVPSEWTSVPPGPMTLSQLDKSAAIQFVKPSPPDAAEFVTVRGHKGFRMIRATHGVCEGAWYYEVTVLGYEGDGAVRLGWSTRRSDTETPVGFDSYGFAIRDRTGEFVHNAKLRAHGKQFGKGDVIGCCIRMPKQSVENKKKVERSDYQWLEYRFIQFLQGKKPPDTGLILETANIEFFVNGESFGISSHFAGSKETLIADQTKTGIPMGRYFPSIALFRNAIVRANFGPTFAYPLPDGCLPICECAPLPEPEPVSASKPRPEHAEGSHKPKSAGASSGRDIVGHLPDTGPELATADRASDAVNADIIFGPDSDFIMANGADYGVGNGNGNGTNLGADLDDVAVEMESSPVNRSFSAIAGALDASNGRQIVP
jgi:hypothetical protein